MARVEAAHLPPPALLHLAVLGGGQLVGVWRCGVLGEHPGCGVAPAQPPWLLVTLVVCLAAMGIGKALAAVRQRV